VEYQRLLDAGAFDDEHVELLGGAIVEMSPRSAKHAAVVTRAAEFLKLAVGTNATVRVQMPFAAPGESLAEPDVAVVPPAHYDDAHPETAFLLVEVADASLRKDRVLESELYARAGVPEYWIVNLADRSIEVRKNPANDAYTALDTFVAGDTIRLAAFDAAITVSDILR
jgi:Uma2 family endonuclease